MSGRLTYMKYAAIIAVAVFSLLVAIPLSKTSATKLTHSSFKPVAHKVVSAVIAAPAPVKPIAQVAAFSVTGGCQQYLSLVSQYNWNVSTAMAIMQAESTDNGIPCDSQAVSNADINPDGVSDFGLFQLHGVDILDPAQNVAYAYYHKYLTQGWEAWSTYNSGKYEQYLN